MKPPSIYNQHGVPQKGQHAWCRPVRSFGPRLAWWLSQVGTYRLSRGIAQNLGGFNTKMVSFWIGERLILRKHPNVHENIAGWSFELSELTNVRREDYAAGLGFDDVWSQAMCCFLGLVKPHWHDITTRTGIPQNLLLAMIWSMF